MTDRKREFPDWEKLYRDEKMESMPWFHPALDKDLESALERLSLTSGEALDLGTGPGTQAVALAQRGFSVVATDLSPSAIEKAAEQARERGVPVDFRQDDILSTRLEKTFDFVFDRGCFHVLPPERRPEYVRTVKRLLKPGGFLFLKCFSHLEKMEGGPYRFTPGEIRDIFAPELECLSIDETRFQGTLKENPLALFCVFRKS